MGIESSGGKRDGGLRQGPGEAEMRNRIKPSRKRWAEIEEDAQSDDPWQCDVCGVEDKKRSPSSGASSSDQPEVKKRQKTSPPSSSSSAPSSDGAQNSGAPVGAEKEATRSTSGQGGEFEETDEEFGELKLRMRRTSPMPSKEEQLAHERTHLPYRSWCRACVAGRKPNWGHATRPLGPRGRPEVHMDYCFPRDSEGGVHAPTVVIKDRDTKAIAAHVIPFKGGDQEYAVQQACRDLRRWGIVGDATWVILRCDQEHALRDFANEVSKVRSKEGNGTRTFIEHNAVGESQSNGFIESGVKSVEGLLRTMKHAFEERLQVVLPVEHPVFSWMVEHVADCLTKFQVGPDGKAPYERLKGKPYRGEVFHFASRVQHRILGKTQGGLMADRWLEGVHLGTRMESREHIVAMDDGRIVRAGAVQAVAEEVRWDSARVTAISGQPWDVAGTVTRVNRGELVPPHRDERVDGEEGKTPPPNGGADNQEDGGAIWIHGSLPKVPCPTDRR